MLSFTAVATLISHRYWEYSDAGARQAQITNYSKNVTIKGGFLALAHGTGRFALDRFLHLRSPPLRGRGIPAQLNLSLDANKITFSAHAMMIGLRHPT